jgi:hypothetical protein
MTWFLCLKPGRKIRLEMVLEYNPANGKKNCTRTDNENQCIKKDALKKNIEHAIKTDRHRI